MPWNALTLENSLGGVSVTVLMPKVQLKDELYRKKLIMGCLSSMGFLLYRKVS